MQDFSENRGFCSGQAHPISGQGIAEAGLCAVRSALPVPVLAGGRALCRLSRAAAWDAARAEINNMFECYAEEMREAQ